MGWPKNHWEIGEIGWILGKTKVEIIKIYPTKLLVEILEPSPWSIHTHHKRIYSKSRFVWKMEAPDDA